MRHLAELEKLGELKAAGLLTEQEFEREKARIMKNPRGRLLVFIVLAWLVIGYFYFSGNSSGNANAGGASAPAARPNVIFADPNMAVGEMRMEKTGEWTIRFGRRDHPTADLMTIRPSTVEGNAGGGFKVYWS